MNFNREPTKIVNRPPTGPQYLFTFDNGYTASVATGYGAYGGMELAVLAEGELCYDTPITSDVLGHLTVEAVNDLLDLIENLPPR